MTLPHGLLIGAMCALLGAWGAVGASPAAAQAPSDCPTRLAEARSAYLSAAFTEAATQVAPCARAASSPDSTRARAYRLLSFVRLAQNNTPAARRAVEGLLDVQPQYTPQPDRDRPDFVALVRAAKAARRPAAESHSRRWLRWALGAAAVALGTAAAVLLGGGDEGSPDPLPAPAPPPQ
jgi:hypothetical protein